MTLNESPIPSCFNHSDNSILRDELFSPYVEVSCICAKRLAITKGRCIFGMLERRPRDGKTREDGDLLFVENKLSSRSSMRNILRKEVISLINMLIFRVLSRALTSRRHQFEKKSLPNFIMMQTISLRLYFGSCTCFPCTSFFPLLSGRLCDDQEQERETNLPK